MNFASPIFLFAFLPLVLIAYHLLRPIRAKNVLLIAAGLVFYAFGDLRHLPLLLASCALHYGVGLALMRARRGRRLLLAACVTVDLAVLAAYKWRGALPLGISFYTFQAISYIVDVSRAPQSGTRSFRRALQYLTFFPQLTAGPLMRFSEVQPLLDTRHVTWDGAFDGCSRFICGLAKKLLLAAAAAQLANAVYAQTSFDALCAWTGAVCYCLQLYFDFSGYSDMAVGLGLLFGIRLPENFSAPFLSRSIEEYWRRWHISLGDWLKNYLFYPLLRTKFFMNLPKKLKGKLGKKGAKQATTFLAMLILWFTIGYWHGGAWTFIIGCGLLHWFYIVSGKLMEPLFVKWRAFFHIEKEKKGFILFQRVRTFFLVMIGLVFFRSATVPDALRVLGRGVSGLGLQLFGNGVLSGLGLEWTELMILAVSILFSAWVTIHNQKEDMRVTLEKKPIWLRWIALYALLFYVILLGKYGPGYSASEFIYQNFKV